MSTLSEACRGRWPELLARLGVPASSLTGKHGPCPACEGKDRFRFDDKDGRGTWYCNRCGAGDGIALVMKIGDLTFAEAAERIELLVGRATKATRRPPRKRSYSKGGIGLARQLWKEGRPIARGDAVSLYLEARGIGMAIDTPALRFNARSLYHDGGHHMGQHPTMLAIVHGSDGRAVGLHRTFLTADGRKADVPAPRKLLGTLPEGAAVQLANHGEELGIAEGIETALSATALFGVPCWAAINANGLAKWSPPEGVSSVVIFGDNDVKFAGQQAAFTLAHRLACRGLTVRVELPSTVGDDWNDVLQKGGVQ